MTLEYTLLGMAFACALLSVVSAIRITGELEKRGSPTPFPLIGLHLFRNLARYKEMTLKETAKVGPLYYSFIISINAAWILALMAWLLRR